MHPTLPLLRKTDFPPIQRRTFDTLQVNLGYLCNQTCQHCHVDAGPNRKEQMNSQTVELLLAVIRDRGLSTLDLTGGAPEMNPNFRYLVSEARKLGVRVIDRCNLTILLEPGYEDLADFLAGQGVEITASLPCYSQSNVDQQRGGGVFEKSIAALQLLNSLGYAIGTKGLILNLVYNPQGPALPPAQQGLEEDYKRELAQQFGIYFDQLYVLANMPIQRFGSMLISKGQFSGYMALLKDSYRTANLDTVMCRNLISVDWEGFLYDCDFNQMLRLPLRLPASMASPAASHLRDLLGKDLTGLPITVADHCYGCTAGQGSSCGGALAA